MTLYTTALLYNSGKVYKWGLTHVIYLERERYLHSNEHIFNILLYTYSVQRNYFKGYRHNHNHVKPKGLFRSQNDPTTVSEVDQTLRFPVSVYMKKACLTNSTIINPIKMLVPLVFILEILAFKLKISKFHPNILVFQRPRCIRQLKKFHFYCFIFYCYYIVKIQYPVRS